MYKTFFKFAVLYLIFAMILTTLVWNGEMTQLVTAMNTATGYLSLGGVGFLLLPAAAVILWARKRTDTRPADMFWATITMVLFLAAFHMLKSAVPELRPFAFDPVLAALDRSLHFGKAPWEYTQALAPYFDLDAAVFYYSVVWVVVSVGFPLMLAAFDPDESRRRRYLLLFVFVWIGLGNVLSLAIPAAGPVYFDRLYGGTEFSGLTAAMQENGVAASAAGLLQNFLWAAYEMNLNMIGSGISAFPSIHVAVAALLALYAIERSRWFLLPAVLHVVAITFLSVHLGWHYAVDGYVSVLAVALGAWGLRAWQRTGPGRDGAAPLPDVTGSGPGR